MVVPWYTRGMLLGTTFCKGGGTPVPSLYDSVPIKSSMKVSRIPEQILSFKNADSDTNTIVKCSRVAWSCP